MLYGYVLTAVGLSMAYSITGELVQGGGMDPYFHIWNSLFLAGLGVGDGGIGLQLWDVCGPPTYPVRSR